jgi:hypothetical protein
MDIRIVTPPVASQGPGADLVYLTEQIWRRYHPGEVYGYGLGGAFGYGVDFENDVFAMRMFWWGDCECAYRDGDGVGDFHEETCRCVLPNFAHKSSGVSVDWYKWIGRDMEFSRKVSREEWGRLFAECLASLGPLDAADEMPSPLSVW